MTIFRIFKESLVKLELESARSVIAESISDKLLEKWEFMDLTILDSVAVTEMLQLAS